MSETPAREHSFSVRLSPEEKAQLETLAAHYGLDRSAAVRKALRLALGRGPSLPRVGCFTPLHAEGIAFRIRLSGKAAHGR